MAELIFEGEFNAQRSRLEAAGLTRSQYINSRLIDEGFNSLELAEQKADGGAEQSAESVEQTPLEAYWDPIRRNWVASPLAASEVRS